MVIGQHENLVKENLNPTAHSSFNLSGIEREDKKRNRWTEIKRN